MGRLSHALGPDPGVLACAGPGRGRNCLPMPFELTWEPCGVYRRYHGDVTLAERRISFDRICADPRFDALRYAITDYLDVKSYEITPRATKEIAALHIAPLHTNPRIVVAAVVVDPSIVEAIEHFISLAFTQLPYRIFPTQQEARAWIDGLGPAQEHPRF